MKKKSVISNLLLILAIVAVVNVIAQRFILRLDFTADGQYTLSNASRKILTGLDEVITVNAYFSEELPPQLLKIKEDFKNQLIEYRAISGGNIEYKFINPNQSEQSEQDAQQKGIAPLLISVNENDKVQQLRAYMGLTLEKGGKTETIASIMQPLQSGISMEYALISAIRKISIKSKSKLGFIQGNDEAKTSDFEPVLKELRTIYDIEEYTLKPQESIPPLYKSVIWLNPKDTLQPFATEKINEYLSRGGKVFLAFDVFKNNNQMGSNFVFVHPDVGLRAWLRRFGVEVDSAMVIDTKCGQIMAVQDLGGLRVQIPVVFPYMIQATALAKHPTTEGLEAVYMTFTPALSLSKQTQSQYSVLPLISSSEQTGRVMAPFVIDINKKWTQADFGEKQKMLAALIEGNGGKLIVLPTAYSFTVSQNGQPQLPPDNLNFAINALEWLSDDSGLMEVRNKTVTSRILNTEGMSDATRNTIKYANLLMPVLLILAYAMVRRSQYKAKQMRWMEGRF